MQAMGMYQTYFEMVNVVQLMLRVLLLQRKCAC